MANNSSLWRSLYLFHWDEPFITLKSKQSWKALFLKKNKEFVLSQIVQDKSYARKKNVRSANLITELPKQNIWLPEKKITDKKLTKENQTKKQADRKKKRQQYQEEIVENFLAERKQFFNSFYMTSLATTPMKK